MKIDYVIIFTGHGSQTYRAPANCFGEYETEDAARQDMARYRLGRAYRVFARRLADGQLLRPCDISA
jgi:hypothetical protein